MVTVALVATKHFANNHRIMLDVIQQSQYMSESMSRSRLNRRLLAIRDWLAYMPELFSDMRSTSTIIVLTTCRFRYVVVYVRSTVPTSLVRSTMGSALPKRTLFGWKLHLVSDSVGIPTHSFCTPSTTPLLSMVWHAHRQFGAV